jgi:hypothetical protein
MGEIFPCGKFLYISCWIPKQDQYSFLLAMFIPPTSINRMHLSPKNYLYTTPEDCCSTWYPSISDCPMPGDDGVQDGYFWIVDGAYFPNWKGDWCAQGNDYPEWMSDPTQRETHLFKTAKECCDLWFKEESETCQNNIAVSSSGNYVSGPPPFGGTWYPSLNGKFECLDGNPPDWMKQEGYEAYYVFKSHAECCKAHFCQDIRGVVNS